MGDTTQKLPRLDSLDLLRGIAILGIFLMNTQDMSMPVLAYYNPLAYDAAAYIDPANYHGISNLTYAVFAIIHVIADLKFITVFSTLFGAGILLQGERLLAGSRPSKSITCEWPYFCYSDSSMHMSSGMAMCSRNMPCAECCCFLFADFGLRF